MGNDLSEAYYIAHWDTHFEVNDKGRAFEPGEERRKKSLPFVRMPCHGADWQRSYRRGVLASGMAFENAVAVFLMACQVSGQLPGGLRGYLLEDSKTCTPYTIERFAADVGFSVDGTQNGFDVLMHPDVAWIVRKKIRVQEMQTAAENMTRRAPQQRKMVTYVDVCKAMETNNPAVSVESIGDIFTRIAGDLGVAEVTNDPRPEFWRMLKAAQGIRGVDSEQKLEAQVRAGMRRQG
jgi:hypothetical protein